MKTYDYVVLVSTVLLLHSGYLSAACNVINGKSYGDCGNVNIIDNLKGMMEIRSDESVPGIISGAIVRSGGSMYLTGISKGDIKVEKGGRLVVKGMVNGTVTNYGGLVEIDGKVDSVNAIKGITEIGGIVSYVTGSGKVVYKRGAIIRENRKR
jgi:hypothetical protein